MHAVCKKMARNGPEIVILKYGSIFNTLDDIFNSLSQAGIVYYDFISAVPIYFL